MYLIYALMVQRLRCFYGQKSEWEILPSENIDMSVFFFILMESIRMELSILYFKRLPVKISIKGCTAYFCP